VGSVTEKKELQSPRQPAHNYTEECPARKKGMVQCIRPSLDCRECVTRAKELKSYTGAYVMYLEGGNIVVTGREKFKNFKAVFVMHEAEGFFRSCFSLTPSGTLPCPELIEVETEHGLKEWVCRATDAKAERERMLRGKLEIIDAEIEKFHKSYLDATGTAFLNGLLYARTRIFGSEQESLRAHQHGERAVIPDPKNLQHFPFKPEPQQEGRYDDGELAGLVEEMTKKTKGG
jgi:hypothetical protein